jgi:SAM-dependent methyltransferase
LNLGCGHDELVRPVIESLGYQYIGLDYELSINPSLCSDAHHLPFGNDSFDAILALAVFEHFHSPWLVIQEIGRVAKENTLIVGEVPQLHPFHGDSYFNFTFLGIERLLEMGDFECIKIQPGESVGAHFLSAFISPLTATPLCKIVNWFFGVAMFCRRLAAKLYYKVLKDKLKDEDSRRVLYLLERQDIIFAGGLKFIGRKK